MLAKFQGSYIRIAVDKCTDGKVEMYFRNTPKQHCTEIRIFIGMYSVRLWILDVRSLGMLDNPSGC